MKEMKRTIIILVILVTLCSSAWADSCYGLVRAAEAGNLAAVERMLEAGLDVNCEDPPGFTPLMLAASRSYTDIVKLLISAGVNTNMESTGFYSEGYTALMSAAKNAHKEIVELLISAGADVNVQNNYSRTALMMAEDNGHTEIVEILINAGAVE